VAKKRGNGEGSITRRKDGLYMARYTVQTATGAKRKALYGKTRQEVSEKLSKALADRDGGLTFDAENLAVSGYLDRWLRDSVKGSVRERTYKSYEQQVRRYLKPYLGRIKLRKLSPMHVQGMYRQMQDRGLSARTVQYSHAVLHRALKQARRWGIVGRNVTEDVDTPQVKREEIQPLNPDQTRALLKAAEGNRLEALYIVAVHTGMRPGEMLALKWDDVNLDSGILQVNRALTGGEFTAPKTARSRRWIKLTASGVKALRVHRKRQLEERMQRAGFWQDYNLVFPSSVGTPLSHRNVVRSFKAVLNRAGLPKTVRLYDLRHTCATLLLSRNVHPKYVQELLGHASIALTLDTYSHVIPGMDGGTASAMEDTLG
jgi:integrase